MAADQTSRPTLTSLKQAESVSMIFRSIWDVDMEEATAISETTSSLAFSIIFFSRKDRGLSRLR